MSPTSAVLSGWETSSQQKWKYLDPIRNAGLFGWVWMLKSVIPAGNYQIFPQPTPCGVFVWLWLSAAGRSCVWTPADDDYANLTIPKHYCTLQTFVAAPVTLLPFLILSWVFMIRDFEPHIEAFIDFRSPVLHTWDSLHIINRSPEVIQNN